MAPAIAVGRLMRAALAEAPADRPVFDSEHGPIHRFKDRKRTLPAAFDDEYFRHIQWAHLASGGAGGGMRWPNRHPHVLTSGMRDAQAALAAFLPSIDWAAFRRRNLNDEARVSDAAVAPFACGDDRQAIVWLLRTDAIGRDGRLDDRRTAANVTVDLPCPAAGAHDLTWFDTRRGAIVGRDVAVASAGRLAFEAAVRTDVAVAIRRRAG